MKIDYLLIALVEFVNFINYIDSFKIHKTAFLSIAHGSTCYNSGSFSSGSEECELGSRGIRKVYLITYSQANT